MGDPSHHESVVLPRELTESEKAKLASQQVALSAFKQQLLEKDAQKNWDLFYKRNTTAFYKDRHWTSREFPELKQEKIVLLEAGCGVGNFLFPLLEENPQLFVYACDFSHRAIKFVKENGSYCETRCKAFQCDLTKDDIMQQVAKESVDYASLIFVLSAILPEKMVSVLQNIHEVLKPGGCILVRDYGLYDHAMLRFNDNKLSENLYVRQDNTRAYYFSLEVMDRIFANAGFKMIERAYVGRRTINKKEGVDVPRIFVQGRYCKPA